MYNYCTLFDSNYLTRGLAMYRSLQKYSESFHLYIFAFDDQCFQLLQRLELGNVTVISLKEFEDKKLLEIKKTRSKAEYCWTCTPSIIKYSLDNYSLGACTYLDADLYFFSNPAVLIDEMQSDSVLITEHRYTSKYYKQNIKNGIYCVQFMTFKNDENGMKVLKWWQEACNVWCYARYEDGKFGDQKYLDNWLNMFEGIHVLKNFGGGMAPWNIQQYDLKYDNKELLAEELESGEIEKVVFYHFHYLKYLEKNRVELGIYVLNSNVIEKIYKSYLILLDKINAELRVLDSTKDYNGIGSNNEPWIKALRRRVIGTYNIYNKQELIGE